jgi:hypothetical protein
MVFLLYRMNDRRYRSPQTSRTLGPRIPSHATTPAPNTERAPVESSSRRLKRYSLAEEALASTLQHRTQEASPQELQIRALEAATALLSAHAKGAQERAAKLRVLLADREVDRDTYEALQRERWMEEKRQVAVDREAKLVRQHLVSLTRPSLDEPAALGKGPVVDAASKRQANLAKFFELSSRTPISTHKSRQSYVDRSPRRRTICHVTPMRLHTSPVTSGFSRSVRGHSRSVSLDASRLSLGKRISFGRPLGSPITASLGVVTEDAILDQSTLSNLSPFRATDGPAAVIAEGQHSVTCTRRPTADAVRGVATIYQPMQARSKAEILADWSTEDVGIPDYAVNLMEHLDVVIDDITLRSRLDSHSRQLIHFVSDSAIRVRPSSSPSRPATPPRQRPFFALESSSSRLRLKRTAMTKKPSHRHLTLFGVSEASSSQDSICGFSSDNPLDRKSSPFFRDRHETAPSTRLPGMYHDCAACDMSPAVCLESDGSLTLADKVKRRFSLLRRR